MYKVCMWKGLSLMSSSLRKNICHAPDITLAASHAFLVLRMKGFVCKNHLRFLMFVGNKPCSRDSCWSRVLRFPSLPVFLIFIAETNNWNPKLMFSTRIRLMAHEIWGVGVLLLLSLSELRLWDCLSISGLPLQLQTHLCLLSCQRLSPD